MNIGSKKGRKKPTKKGKVFDDKDNSDRSIVTVSSNKPKAKSKRGRPKAAAEAAPKNPDDMSLWERL